METRLSGLRRHPILVLGGYFIIYMISFELLEAWSRPMHLVHCGLDDIMPFCEWFVLPYVAWFAWVPLVLFLFMYRDRDNYWKLFGALVSGITVAMVAYVVYPTGLALRHAITQKDPLSQMIAAIYRADTSTNVCPSLHVFVTVLLFVALCNAPWMRSMLSLILHGVLALAICASTVLIDQHSVIDVILGAVLALICYSIFFFVRIPSTGTARKPARASARG